MRRFGDMQRLRGECRVLADERDRTVHRAEVTMELLRDVQYALRQLWRARGFTAAAVLTLGLGIGAAAAMFGAVDAVLLRPLPLPAPDRLVVPRSVDMETGATWSVAYADYEDWRNAGVFDAVAAFQRSDVNVAGAGEAEQVAAAAVTEDFFRTLRIAPVLGTTFGSHDFIFGSSRRALISHRLWQRVFGGDAGIVGRAVSIAGLPREVAGVLPDGMSYPADVDVWFALQVNPEARADFERRDNYVFESLARLGPGTTMARAELELKVLAERVARAEPATRANVTTALVPLQEFVVGERASRTLWILFAAVGMVLLIACVNVANLLLGRSTVRTRELAIRTSMGASRGRIARQLITEAVVLALLGGAAGVLIALAAVRAVTAFAPEGVPRLDAIAVDGRVLGFALVAALFCALLFGVFPALRAARGAAADALAGATTRTTWGREARRRRGALVGAEIALALVLLIGASLLLRSFANLRDTDPGFGTERVLTLSLMLQGERYMSLPRPAAFAELTERMAAVPGVASVAFAGALPLGGGGFYLGRAFLHDAQPEPPAGEEVPALWTPVTPGYFATLGIPLHGRDFTSADRRDSPPVMIVSREFARRMFGSSDPIGRWVRSWRDENVYREIVAVVEDIRYFGAGDEIEPLVFVPHAQDPWGGLSAVIRTAVPPLQVLPAVRTAILAFDPTLGVAEVRTMQQIFDDSVAPSRFAAFLLGTFAALALTLALIGVCGVLSYDIAQRTREIGIRMALGAQRSQITSLVLRDVGRVVILGVIAGSAGAFLLARFARVLLHGVSPADPIAFLGAPLLLAAAALGASLLVSRRAARIEPIRTLGSE